MSVARPASSTYAGWIVLALGVAMDTLGIYLIKQTVTGAGADFDLDALGRMAALLLASPAALSGLLFFLVAPVAMAYGLSRLDLSLAYPVQVGLSFVCVLAISASTGESLTGSRALGVGLVAAGTWIMITSGEEAA